MWTPVIVVPIYVIYGGIVQMLIPRKRMLVNKFCFKGSIETFHWRIVIRTSGSAHALRDMFLFAEFCKCMGSILGSLVAVQDKFPAYMVSFQHRLQCADCQLCINPCTIFGSGLPQ